MIAKEGSSGGNLLDKATEKFQKITDDIAEELRELSQVEAEVKKTIALVDDDELENILILRYLMGRTITQTATLTFYSEESIEKKTRKALLIIAEKTRET